LFVAGRDTGKRTPADLEVGALPVELRLELAGFNPRTLSVSDEQVGTGAEARPVRAVLERLKPADARLRILRAPLRYVACIASVGKAWKGPAFDGLTEIRLPPRTYPITVECAGKAPVEGQLTVSPGSNSANYADVVSLP
jgi:hypothetical protein